jgi:GxxExxY protein
MNQTDPLNSLSEKIIKYCIKIHKELGPGLLESAYEACLAYELSRNNLVFERQKPLHIVYEAIKLDCGYRIDFLVMNSVLLELKSVEQVLPIHEAQLMTYLKLSKIELGLLINFNVKLLKDGITRRRNGFGIGV